MINSGDRLIRFDVTLIRRWADIEQTEKKLSDTIEMTESPHHGDDVKTYFGKDAPLFVRAIKIPTKTDAFAHYGYKIQRFSQLQNPLKSMNCLQMSLVLQLYGLQREQKMFETMQVPWDLISLIQT